MTLRTALHVVPDIFHLHLVPGEASAVLLDQDFAQVERAPADGHASPRSLALDPHDRQVAVNAAVEEKNSAGTATDMPSGLAGSLSPRERDLCRGTRFYARARTAASGCVNQIQDASTAEREATSGPADGSGGARFGGARAIASHGNQARRAACAQSTKGLTALR